ncbi:nucleotide-binding alpha-beta plait domain-containing protein [Tanacetum coccineum]
MDLAVLGFWQSIIKAIYGPNGSLDEPIPRHSGGSVWVMICKSIDSLKSKGVDLMQFCNKVIGNVSSTSFWHERWKEDACFKVRFHRLFDWSFKRTYLLLINFNSQIVFHPLEEGREGVWKRVSGTRWLRYKLLTRSNLSARGVDVPGVLCLMGHYSWDVIGGTSLWWDTRGGTTKVGHQSLVGGCSIEDTLQRGRRMLIGFQHPVYVTNFPDNVSAKELFLACKQYGHVVDSYIPVKKSKYGKRFGFVKFINVFSEERLVNNLCTVWIGRVRLHANIARFQRPNGKNIGEGNKKPNVTPTPSVKPNLSGSLGTIDSFEEGINVFMSMNVDNALFGRVKVFASLANLKMALGNEGFSDIVIKYMGEQWVMLEFKSLESMEKFKKCVSVMSWFSQVIKATNEFEVDGRIAWVEVEGVPFKLWTNNTFTRIAEKWGKLLDVDDQDETCFHSKRLCVYLKAGNSIREDFKITHRGKMYWIRANETQGWVPEFTDEYESEDDNSMDEEGEVKKNGIKDEHSDGEIVPESLFEDGELENNHVDGIFSKKEKEVSEDPFNLYSLLKRQNKLDDKDTNSEDSLKHPPGFTPLTHNCENDTSEKKVDQNDEFSEAGDVDKLKGSANGSISAGHFKVSEIPRTGGSMVGLLEDVIKVGQVMGFKMEGVIANLEELIGTQGGKEGYR